MVTKKHLFAIFEQHLRPLETDPKPSALKTLLQIKHLMNGVYLNIHLFYDYLHVTILERGIDSPRTVCFPYLVY